MASQQRRVGRPDRLILRRTDHGYRWFLGDRQVNQQDRLEVWIEGRWVAGGFLWSGDPAEDFELVVLADERHEFRVASPWYAVFRRAA